MGIIADFGICSFAYFNRSSAPGQHLWYVQNLGWVETNLAEWKDGAGTYGKGKKGRGS